MTATTLTIPAADILPGDELLPRPMPQTQYGTGRVLRAETHNQAAVGRMTLLTMRVGHAPIEVPADVHLPVLRAIE